MHFLSSLAKTLEELRRISEKYQDEEIQTVVSSLYKQLTIIINVLEKIYMVYNELDILMKTDLKIEPGLYLDVEAPQQEKKLADYVAEVKSAGQDPEKVVAYLLGPGVARLAVRGGDVYILPAQSPRY